MAALSFGFDELERRLDLIRRRHNLYALQDAFCKAGTVILGGGAVVLAVAGFGSDALVGPAVATYFVLALGVTAHFALRARRHWLSIDDAAELTDREAGLDCRLATLLAQRNSSSRSRLRALLLSQVFLLASRWTAQRIAPRRFPRSAAAFAAALLTFVGVAILTPPPPEPEPAPTAAGITAPSGAPAPQLAAARSANDGAVGPAAAETAMGGGAGGHSAEGGATSPGAGHPVRAGGGTAAPLGHGAARSPQGGDGASPSDAGSARDRATSAGAERPASGEQAAATPPRHDAARASQGANEESPRDGDSERRHAAAPPAANATDRDDPDHRKQNSRRAADESHAEHTPGTDGRERAASSRHETGDADRNEPPGRRSQQQTDKNRDLGRQNPGEDESRGGARADRGSEDGPAEKSGLYGTPKGEAAPASDAAAMLIKLTAFSAVAPQEFERQGKGGAGDLAADHGAGAGETPLAAQLNRETPLLRAPLAVEHESIVREIFTPR